MKKRMDAGEAIRRIARKQGVPDEDVRRQMEQAILSGMRHPDPAVSARWKQIPCKGDVPTPEELITYAAAYMDAGIDPFA